METLLLYILGYTIVILIVVPERFFWELGMPIDDTNIFPYLLFWIVFYILIRYLIKGVRKILQKLWYSRRADENPAKN
jgi:amino acid transporter